MSLLQMSFSGGVIILAAALVRALGRDRLPKRTFGALWAVAALRLTVPVSVPFRLSVYSLLAPAPTHGPAAPAAVEGVPLPINTIVNITQGAAQTAPSGSISPWPVIWAAGAVLCAAVFTLLYWRGRRSFRASLPVEGPQLDGWLAAHPLRRRMTVRLSDRVAAPLTYGILRPVILLPRGMDLSPSPALDYVLTHEYIHIRRFDAAKKLALAAVAVLHWFNPLVWAMYALASRDMELACDEAVVRAFGLDARRDYARALLSMEETRGGFAAAASGFSRNAIEERIHSIMKIRPRSFLSTALAVGLVLGAAGFLGTSAAAAEPDTTAPAVLSDGTATNGDGRVYYVFNTDGEIVRMTQEEYDALFHPADVEWWTAEEYAAWLEQEKKDLQDCLGQRAWTGADGWFTWTQDKIDETVAMYEQVLEDIKNGMMVSKTMDGQTDASLTQGTSETPYSGEDGIVMYKYDSPENMSGPYSSYYFTFADGDDSTILGPYDTPEALREAMEAEIAVSLADGRLTEEAAQDLLDNYAPAPNTMQLYVPGSKITYSFNGGQSVELTEEEKAALDVLLENQEVADAMNVAVDEELYSVETVLPDDLQEVQDTLEALKEEFAAKTAVLQEQRRAQKALEDTLEPYLPFGLQYTYDASTGQYEMRWNGREVRGIYDDTADIWITPHAGTGYGEHAVELVAVYTDGELTGLRLATAEEQAQWDALRVQEGLSPEEEAE